MSQKKIQMNYLYKLGLGKTFLNMILIQKVIIEKVDQYENIKVKFSVLKNENTNKSKP